MRFAAHLWYCMQCVFLMQMCELLTTSGSRTYERVISTTPLTESLPYTKAPRTDGTQFLLEV